jgi:deoxycytidylate deaminase
MNSKDKIFMDIAIGEAKGNPTTLPRMAAVIVFKNEVISIGYNQRKSHPFQKQFSQSDLKICLHAETDALRKALKILDCKEISKTRIYIARVLKNDSIAKAKPCTICQNALNAYGIQAYWTDRELTHDDNRVGWKEPSS